MASRLFRTAAILTLYRHLTTIEHMQHNQMATIIDQISQPTQALLHELDSVQPAGIWKPANRDNIMIFIPSEVNYNPLRQQTFHYVLILQDPRSIQSVIKCLV